MLSSLPSLAPRDSYALWYTSNHNSSDSSPHQEPTNHAFDHLAPAHGQGHNATSHTQRRQQSNNSQRTPLAQLRADEMYMERRKQNVQNYGSSWIKPPGVFKSLHQLREERREMEEHQEALRREQLAQELAEAEGGDELLQGDGPDGEMEEVRDLDDDIPDADITGVDAEESENDGGDNEDDVPRGVLAQRMPEDAYREALVRGEELGDRGFGGDGASVTDEEDQSQMLQEEDLIHEHGRAGEQDIDMGMDMDADLDDDVPEAGAGEYEHTDTEAELSSSEEEDDDDDDDERVDMGRLPQGRPLNASLVRSDGTQNSMDLNSMDFRSGSSILGSSPQQRRDSGRARN